MSFMLSTHARWPHVSAIIGGLVWLLLLVAVQAESETIALITQLLLLAVLVFVPLALGLATPGGAVGGARLLGLAERTQPIAAVATAAAFLLPSGVLPGILTISWLIFAAITAASGMLRLVDRRMHDLPELCIGVGLLLLPVGGFWLVMARFGLRPLGFGHTIVLLTAVHFHYAGFALLTLTGLVGRRLRLGAPAARGTFRLVARGIVAGVPLVALGITFSRELEITAVLLLVASVLGLAILTLVAVVPLLKRRIARVLLACSALSSVATMLLAAVYALGSIVGLALTIPEMVLAHGMVNAFGLVLCGLLAWTLDSEHPLEAGDLRGSLQ
jgi:hypothetical protein